MKITHNKVGQNLNLNDANKAGRAGSAADEKMNIKDSMLGALSKDASEVKLSDRAKDIKRAKELALAAPDIREEKVQRLQKLIDDGKYEVSAGDIADKMVDEEAQWV